MIKNVKYYKIHVRSKNMTSMSKFRTSPCLLSSVPSVPAASPPSCSFPPPKYPFLEFCAHRFLALIYGFTFICMPNIW